MKIKGKMIVFVEDEDNLRQAYTDSLEARGALVKQFIKSSDALEWILLGGKCDLIVADINQPGSSIRGHELYKEIRVRGMCIPFILISGLTMQEIQIFAQSSDIEYYLQKPFLSSKLLQKMEEALK